MFPEGTRSADGVLLPFKSGVSKIAELTSFETIPVTVSGSINIMKKGNKAFYPGHAKVSFNKAITWGGEKRAYLEDLKTKIEGGLE